MSWSRQRHEGAEPGDWDAALRLSDRVSHHLVACREVAIFQWIAVRLSDGGAENDTLYPSRADAVAAQLAPQYYAFTQITPDAMSPRAAWRYLLMCRQIHGRHNNQFHHAEYMPILPQRLELARGVFR
ncbi:hypothetical protein JGS39_24145 [Streptomyces sp. P01-B04]|uniref:hypothetical protein n=1 Tax=Streptomyces poriferorum TaxID=2798799 RepID=UPI001C5FE3EE|nr:hypothetical protein [Streptomyces poriferorum]MBW5252054.1 hypothetical protein [Streptomyces poriferorum]MBW5260224.1 hypothetical protein [Streptomyces poriferorum]